MYLVYIYMLCTECRHDTELTSSFKVIIAPTQLILATLYNLNLIIFKQLVINKIQEPNAKIIVSRQHECVLF